MKLTIASALLFASFTLVPIGKLLAQQVPAKTQKLGYIEPFQMFDNLYYVGDKWVSSYLLVTDLGLILIDTLDMPYSRWIPENIRLLGFEPSQIKYILITHPHSDHVAGAGYLQQKYQAKVVMLEQGLDMLKQQSNKHKFIQPKVNVFPKDSETLTLGDTTVTFYDTPGHTKGCMSLAFDVLDKGKTHKALAVCGNGTNFKGVELAKHYMQSVSQLKKLVTSTPKFEVNLATHPHLGQIFERRTKLQSGSAIHPYVDHKALLGFLFTLEQRGRQKLKHELELDAN